MVTSQQGSNGTEPQEKPHTLEEYAVDHFRWDIPHVCLNYFFFSPRINCIQDNNNNLHQFCVLPPPFYSTFFRPLIFSLINFWNPHHRLFLFSNVLFENNRENQIRRYYYYSTHSIIQPAAEEDCAQGIDGGSSRESRRAVASFTWSPQTAAASQIIVQGGIESRSHFRIPGLFEVHGWHSLPSGPLGQWTDRPDFRGTLETRKHRNIRHLSIQTFRGAE